MILTKHSRINLTFEVPTANLLAQLAHQEHKSISGFAKELMLDALERREDVNLSTLAESQDQAVCKKIKHSDV